MTSILASTSISFNALRAARVLALVAAGSPLVACVDPSAPDDEVELPVDAAGEALVASNVRPLVPLAARVAHTCVLEAGGAVKFAL